MALLYIDNDPWITAHDACEKLYRDIQSQLLLYRSQTESEDDQLSSNRFQIRLKLKQYSSEISQLKFQLESIPTDQLITEDEKERRGRQIEKLQSKYLQLQSEFSQSLQSVQPNKTQVYSENREQLLGYQGTSQSRALINVSSSNWTAGSDEEQLIGGQDFYAQAQKEREDLIQDQDRGLEELSKIISRQKNMAINIGNEVTLQNSLIDNIADHVDRVDTNIEAETGHIRLIDRKDRTCGLWTIIILLFIAIMIIGLGF